MFAVSATYTLQSPWSLPSVKKKEEKKGPYDPYRSERSQISPRGFKESALNETFTTYQQKYSDKQTYFINLGYFSPSLLLSFLFSLSLLYSISLISASFAKRWLMGRMKILPPVITVSWTSMMTASRARRHAPIVIRSVYLLLSSTLSLSCLCLFSLSCTNTFFGSHTGSCTWKWEWGQW